MAKPTLWKDEFTLLCEKCGYVLEGLDTAGPCPECGKPIEESLPMVRPGTPWQRKASIVSLIKTWWSMLFRPQRTFDEMDCIEQDGMSLVAVGLILFVAAVVLCIMCIAVFTSSGAEGVSLAMLMAIVGFIYWLAGFVYAWIAMARISWISRMRGYRVSRDAAWAISGHASVGLALPPIVLSLSILLIGVMLLIDHLLTSEFDAVFAVLASIAYISIIVSFPVGLILFETLCTVGVRRCKFRNSLPQSTAPCPQSDLSEPTQTDTRTT